MAASGSVLALNVKLFSPETDVGVQMSGFVPIVQNNSRRLACFGVALRAVGRSHRSDTNGESNNPAPVPRRKCLRFSLRMALILESHLSGLRRVKCGAWMMAKRTLRIENALAVASWRMPA